MIKQIDHVSIAVSDLERAKNFFLDGLGAKHVWSQPMPNAGFCWTILELGESCFIELINPDAEQIDYQQGFVQRFLDTRGQGVHHLTFQVDDLEKFRQLLEKRGIPSFGYGEPIAGWKELFIHPRDAFGILLQFAEFDPLDWIEPGAPIPLPYRRQLHRHRTEREPIRFQTSGTEDEPILEIHQGDQQILLNGEARQTVLKEIANLERSKSQRLNP